MYRSSQNSTRLVCKGKHPKNRIFSVEIAAERPHWGVNHPSENLLASLMAFVTHSVHLARDYRAPLDRETQIYGDIEQRATRLRCRCGSFKRSLC